MEPHEHQKTQPHMFDRVSTTPQQFNPEPIRGLETVRMPSRWRRTARRLDPSTGGVRPFLQELDVLDGWLGSLSLWWCGLVERPSLRERSSFPEFCEPSQVPDCDSQTSKSWPTPGSSNGSSQRLARHEPPPQVRGVGCNSAPMENAKEDFSAEGLYRSKSPVVRLQTAPLTQ